MLNKLKNFWTIENRTKYFVHFLVVFFFASVIAFAMLIVNSLPLEKNQKATLKQKPDPFEKIDLEGKAVVVWDVINNREIFSKNPDLPLPLASLTKVMTAVTANGKLDNNQTIKITPEDLAPEGDSNLVVGDTWRAKDLRDFTLLTSSNDGAFALAATAEANNPVEINRIGNEFIKEMNTTAIKIGLSNSKFFNEHGLDREADRGGAYGSAHDMAILFEYTLKNYPEILEATRYKNLDFTSAENTYSVENTNTFVNQIPNILASKTGYTDLAGGNLVIAFDAGLNRPIIVSVLGASAEGRFSDALNLVSASLQYIQQGD